jgi:hypothetical protein
MLKEMTSLLGGFFGGTGPRKVTVTPVKSPAWKNIEFSLKKSGELKSLLFEPVGYFAIPEKPSITSMQAYVNTKDSCYAVVWESIDGGIVLEITCEYEDGREYCFTSAPKPATPNPLQYRTIEHYPDTETGRIFHELLAKRPAEGLKPVSAENFVRDYEGSHAKQFGFQPRPPRAPSTSSTPNVVIPRPPNILGGSTVEVVQFVPLESGQQEDSPLHCFCLDLMITPSADAGTATWDAKHLTVARSPTAVGIQEEPCAITAVQIYDGENFHDNVSQLTGPRYVRLFVMMPPESAFFRVRYDTKQLLEIEFSEVT